MKNKIQAGIAVLILAVAAFVALEFRRRALTVLCPALLIVGVLWGVVLAFRARKDGGWLIQLCMSGALTIAGIVAMMVGFDVVEVTASDVGVLETWEDGVMPEPLMSRTYIVLPNERLYLHSLDQQLLLVGANNPAHPEYKVQSSDNQDMYFTLRVQWRRAYELISHLHRRVKPGATPEESKRLVEDKLIVPNVLGTLAAASTVKEAITVYSGMGKVELREAVLKALQDPKGALALDGIKIDDIVIDIRLEEAYVGHIQGRQIAQVRKTRADAEAIAADAEALVSKAEAQKQYNIRVTEANTKKEEVDLAAQGLAAQTVAAATAKAKEVELAAIADAAKVKLDAAAKLEAALAEAKGILAIGEAQASADKLKYVAFESPGAAIFAKIEVSKNMGTAFSGIKGYLPESMSITTLGADFQKAIEALVK
jgi:hypothetical protein